MAREVLGTDDICILFASSRGTGIETKKPERQDMSFVSKGSYKHIQCIMNGVSLFKSVNCFVFLENVS